MSTLHIHSKACCSTLLPHILRQHTCHRIHLRQRKWQTRDVVYTHMQHLVCNPSDRTGLYLVCTCKTLFATIIVNRHKGVKFTQYLPGFDWHMWHHLFINCHSVWFNGVLHNQSIITCHNQKLCSNMVFSNCEACCRSRTTRHMWRGRYRTRVS